MQAGGQTFNPLADLFTRGAVLAADEVAARLRISRAAVEQRRRAGQLLAGPGEASNGYPACQVEGGAIVPGLAEVLAWFGLERPWGALAFLLTPANRLGGPAPLDALKRREPTLTGMMIRLARADATADGFG